MNYKVTIDENCNKDLHIHDCIESSTFSASFVNKISIKENRQSQNIIVHVNEENHHNENEIKKQFIVKAQNRQDVEVSFNKRNAIIDIEGNNIQEECLVSDNTFENNGGLKVISQNQHYKEIIKMPVPRVDNAVDCKDFIQGSEIDERPPPRRQRDKPTDNKNQEHGLTSYLPWPSVPDSSVEQSHFENDPATRNFIKSVLIIVLIMIIITAMFITYVLVTPAVKALFSRYGLWILLPALMFLIIADCGMICSACARESPCNVFFLIMTVMAMCSIAGIISAKCNTEVLLYATITTGFVVIVCIFLACSNFDFTSWILFIVVISCTFAIVATIVYISAIISGNVMKPLKVAVLYISSMFLVIMFTIQLQMILDKKSIEIGPKDYALGAFLLYTSSLDIFIRSVHVIGISSK